MGFFEWWLDLPTGLKMGVSLGLIGISTVLWFAGYLWLWGWIIGSILLVFSFPNDAQKRGYHDF
ncbi:MAG: hypothetical protein K2X38_24855 [Gemmataceae bacterium]|nr:hypothetical protein [Gemmataceae bacterium]